MVGGVGAWSGVALECRDPAVLATFYSQVMGWPILSTTDDWCSIGEDEDATFHLSFQRAGGHLPPTWPDPTSSMQAHLHVRVTDLDNAQRRVVALGATVFDHQPNPDGFRVLADPAGHPFCLVENAD